MMADYCTQFVIHTPYFKEGFSYQTGVGGASIASTISLGKIMEERGIHMGLGLGGITTPMCELLEKGLIKKIVDTQDFDLGAIESIKRNPDHIEISASEYANPFNKGAFVNKLDFVILASLEVDVDFNCNVVVGSDGMITGAQGGQRKMHHRHRAAPAGTDPGHLHPCDYGDDSRRDRGRGHHRLRHCHQPQTARPDRMYEGRGPSILHH